MACVPAAPKAMAVMREEMNFIVNGSEDVVSVG